MRILLSALQPAEMGRVTQVLRSSQSLSVHGPHPAGMRKRHPSQWINQKKAPPLTGRIRKWHPSSGCGRHRIHWVSTSLSVYDWKPSAQSCAPSCPISSLHKPCFLLPLLHSEALWGWGDGSAGEALTVQFKGWSSKSQHP